uniref:Uncharacterized protein n=1 Tax=Mola mola TaxID=94237 RepID=A0A3Q3WQV9_MOLML
APRGLISLIDDAHMCAPYASWQGQRGMKSLLSLTLFWHCEKT